MNEIDLGHEFPIVQPSARKWAYAGFLFRCYSHPISGSIHRRTGQVFLTEGKPKQA